MKQLLAVAVVFVLATTPAAAQHYVVLAVSSEAPGGFGSVTLTLNTGARISVPASALVTDITPTVLEALNTGNAARVTSTDNPPQQSGGSALARAAAEASARGGGTISEATPRTEAEAQRPAFNASTDAVIQQKCAADWPDNFSLREVCEEAQREALDALQFRPMTGADEQTIRTKCAADWPDNFSLRNVCEEQQLESLRNLRGR